jgi:hypothetical protein
VTLFEQSNEEPKSKRLRYAISGIALAALIAVALWYTFRFTPEKDTVERFMDAVVAGKLEEAYQIWHPTKNFTYKDFLSFWGPDGYYSPVKSYKIVGIDVPPRNASGVIVDVEISSYDSFPSSADQVKTAQSREAQIWVERSDHSLSFPPP